MIESVTFDKLSGKLILAKTKLLTCKRNQCEISLNSITEVTAVKRGTNKANMDMTFYALILTLGSGQRAKVLETKSLRRIQRELLCVRKFLGINNFELKIVDETKLWKEKLKKEKEKARRQAASGSYTGPEMIELSSSIVNKDSQLILNEDENSSKID